MEEVKIPMPIQLEGLRIMAMNRNATTTAAYLGLEAGDLLVSVAGAMASESDLESVLSNIKAGEMIDVHWIRDGSLMFNSASAMTVRLDGQLTSDVQLGAPLGPRGREKVVSLMHPKTSKMSGFQRGILDVSRQGEDYAKMQRVGGIAFGVVASLGVGYLFSRLTSPRLPQPQIIAVPAAAAK